MCPQLLSFFDLKFISGVGEQSPKSSKSPPRGSFGLRHRGHLPFLVCFLPEINYRKFSYIPEHLFLAQAVMVDGGQWTFLYQGISANRNLGVPPEYPVLIAMGSMSSMNLFY